MAAILFIPTAVLAGEADIDVLTAHDVPYVLSSVSDYMLTPHYGESGVTHYTAGGSSSPHPISPAYFTAPLRTHFEGAIGHLVAAHPGHGPIRVLNHAHPDVDLVFAVGSQRAYAVTSAGFFYFALEPDQANMLQSPEGDTNPQLAHSFISVLHATAVALRNASAAAGADYGW